MYIHVYLYIYVYVHRERERGGGEGERERDRERERERERKRGLLSRTGCGALRHSEPSAGACRRLLHLAPSTATLPLVGAVWRRADGT